MSSTEFNKPSNREFDLIYYLNSTQSAKAVLPCRSGNIQTETLKINTLAVQKLAKHTLYSGTVLGGFLGFPETPFGLDYTQTKGLADC